MPIKQPALLTIFVHIPPILNVYQPFASLQLQHDREKLLKFSAPFFFLICCVFVFLSLVSDRQPIWAKFNSIDLNWLLVAGSELLEG